MDPTNHFFTVAQLREQCMRAGIVPEQHCCLYMAFFISDPVIVPHQGPNPVLEWIAMWNEYRIPISRTGYQVTRILHCPWCGSKLPASVKEEWYQTLYALGYSDPGNDHLPEEFNSDKWWRDRLPKSSE